MGARKCPSLGTIPGQWRLVERFGRDFWGFSAGGYVVTPSSVGSYESAGRWRSVAFGPYFRLRSCESCFDSPGLKNAIFSIVEPQSVSSEGGKTLEKMGFRGGFLRVLRGFPGPLGVISLVGGVLWGAGRGTRGERSRETVPNQGLGKAEEWYQDQG